MSKATSTKTAFRMECSVSADIKATPEKIWALLTNATNFPKWNSTVISIEGAIVKNGRIKLTSTSSPKRVFNLTVSEFTPPAKMVWSDGNFIFRGVRTFDITPKAGGITEFRMQEVFTGLMLPMIGGSLPDFKPFFDRFAADLKTAAEKK